MRSEGQRRTGAQQVSAQDRCPAQCTASVETPECPRRQLRSSNRLREAEQLLVVGVSLQSRGWSLDAPETELFKQIKGILATAK